MISSGGAFKQVLYYEPTGIRDPEEPRRRWLFA
jgi:hypothetical protein